MQEDNQISTLPQISVVMAIYKEPIDWMKLAIESVLNQTYNDFEFIIINDNPTRKENTELLNEYVSIDCRIHVITNDKNIGLTKSLNKGLQTARGKYIARMDADDISLSTRFEKQLNFMNNNPHIGAVGCNAFVINEKSEIVSKISRPNDENALRILSIFESPIFHPASFFRRVISNEIIKYDENVKYSQDYALWVSLLEKCDIANLPERLLMYRVNTSQISCSHHTEQQEYAFKNQLKAISNLDIKLSKEDVKYFKGLTRPNTIENINYISLRNFIISFLGNNKSKLGNQYKIVSNRMILIYANLIASDLSFLKALYSLLILQLKINNFNLYSILSLINKYRLKFNLK